MNALSIDPRAYEDLALWAVDVAVERVALVLVVADRVFRYVPIPNASPTPETSFALEPEDIALRKLLERTGLEVVLFHSHVDTEAYPSSGDRRWATVGERQLIFGLDGLRCFAFAAADPERVRDGLEVVEVELRVLDLPNT